MKSTAGRAAQIACLSAACLALNAASAPTFIADPDSGPHHRRWRPDAPRPLQSDDASAPPPGFIQLEPGLNRWEGGRWVETSEDVEVRGGRVVARGTQHKVAWAANANSRGAMEIEFPDGLWLRGHCLGLGYYDAASGRSVLIAELRDTRAEVHPRNLVLYRNAFDDLDADLLYVNRRASLEQYVVLHEPPPPPEDYRMDPQTTRLEVISEFLDAPKPRKAARILRREHEPQRRARFVEPDLIDETLDFGAMFMGPGQAFLPSGDALRMEAASAIPMAKRWEVIDGRNVLFEAVEYASLQPLLASLPPRDPTLVARRTPAAGRCVPAPRLAGGQDGEVRVAASATPIRGVVLDYTLLNSGPVNYTFQGDRTYFVSGSVALGGSNTTFEAGTVIKFAPTNNARLDVASTNLTWLGTAYRPVILTARDDASVGETITNAPLAGTYAAVALHLQPPLGSATIAHLRVSHAQTAIALNSGSNHVLSHLQLVGCGTGLRMANAEARIRNVLMTVVSTNFDLAGSTARVEHLTASQGTLLNTGGTLLLTNSLLAGIATTNAWSGTPNAVIPAASGVFSSSASGSHYLPPNSPYRDAGSGQISPSLLTELRSLTTTAPTWLSGPIVTPAVIRPRVLRDVDQPDLGYHYPPIDLIASNVQVQAELTLTNGVAVAIAGAVGFELQAGSRFISEGAPSRPNRLAGLGLVQEQPIVVGQPVAFSIAASSGLPSLRLRFTDLSTKAGAAGTLVDATAAYFADLSLRDCTWRCGAYATLPGPVAPLLLALTNNVLDRVALTLTHALKSQNAAYSVRMFNNLLRNGSLAITYVTGSTNPVWEIQDNLFDGCSQTVSGSGISAYLTVDHNGFTASTLNGMGGDLNRVAVGRDFLTGPLGGTYYPVLGSGLNQLRNAGSRSDAAQASLFHYTTTLDQAREANSTVDIGFHFVSTDASGVPIDQDGDGAPDVLEDRNGNNLLDPGEASWTESSHGLIGLAALQVFTPLK